MERLSATDNLFWWLERRHQPLHVARLQIYRFPDDAGPHYIRDLADYLRQFQQPTAPFDQRLLTRWSGYHWGHDERFDVEHHFRHVALPKPGGPKELLSFISAEHSNLLDRSRPLWDTYLVEAMHGLHFALYTKIHHALVDGVSAMRLGMRMLGTDPQQQNLPPLWQLPPRERNGHRGEASGFLSQFSALARLVGSQVTAVPTV